MRSRNEYQKEWRKKNPEKVKKASREWAKRNPEKIQKIHREWAKNNPTKIKEYNRKWKEKTPEKQKGYRKKWNERNPEKVRNQQRLWNERNRIRLKEWWKRYNLNPKRRIEIRMGNSIRKALREEKKGQHWESLVDYTVDDLMKHLESKFTNGMNWKVFLQGKIHIDHIIPKSRFCYQIPEDPEFKICWGLNNLQPLWAKDNRVKHTKLSWSETI